MSSSPTMDPQIEARARVWLVLGDKPVFGDGRARLLDAIRKTGSIKGAAEALGMSYRHAWGHVNHIEKRLGMKMVERQIGGRKGGGSRLTPEADDLLSVYHDFRVSLEKDMAKAWQKAVNKIRRRGK